MPRRQLATKAARKFAPATSGVVPRGELINAAWHGDADEVAALLAGGADVNEPEGRLLPLSGKRGDVRGAALTSACRRA